MYIELRQTCGACPEQYDAYVDDKRVGYLRLRHGVFTVEFPYCPGEVVYVANPRGDGVFEMSERDFYITQAKKALEKRIIETNYVEIP